MVERLSRQLRVQDGGDPRGGVAHVEGPHVEDAKVLVLVTVIEPVGVPGPL